MLDQDVLTEAQARIAKEADEKTGYLDLGGLLPQEIPDSAFALDHPLHLNLGKFYFRTNAETGRRLSWESKLLCSLTKGVETFEWSCLAHFQKLRALSVQNLGLTTLSGLEGLQSLTVLDCSSNPLKELSDLSGLTGLTKLYCFGNELTDLNVLSGLTGLTELDCSSNQLRDLNVLSGLTGLTELDCSDNELTDLNVLSGLTGLTELKCFGNQLTELPDLSCLTGLIRLDCDGNPLTDPSAVIACRALETLEITYTKINAIDDILQLPRLKVLRAGGLNLQSLPSDPAYYDLELMVLYQSQIKNLPSELLGEHEYDDCSGAVKAHFEDLANGHVSLPRVKLMILGNGRVGKTQLRRRLSGEDFIKNADSTHGIQIMPVPLPNSDVQLYSWDFGGQDIYLGTHALFMRTRAITCICWSPDFERGFEDGPHGQRFERQPLVFWLDYVRQMAGDQNPVFVVETRCDSTAKSTSLPLEARGRLEKFAYQDNFALCSESGRKIPALIDELKDAAQWMQEKYGTMAIGKGRLAIMNQLDDWRQQDADKSGKDKQYQTISWQTFERLCEKEGINSPHHFADFLHHYGTIFYRKGLFNDQIILDQSWALDAVYAVFNRDNCAPIIKEQKGRFRPSLLQSLVWNEYDDEERKLFLSLMLSCDIIFPIRAESSYGAAEYVAPDFLPDNEVRDEAIWRESEADDETVCAYETDFIHPALMRTIISSIGRQAGLYANYWRSGLCFYDRKSNASAKVELVQGEGWAGSVQLTTRGQGRSALMHTMIEKLNRIISRLGLSGGFAMEEKHTGQATSQAISEAHRSDQSSPDRSELALDYARPKAETTYAVSYSWADEKKADKTKSVERLCKEAEALGIEVLRDKDAMKVGDQISRFMDQIAASDRVFIMLSENYLKSPNCMYELNELWKFQRQKPDQFNQAARVFVRDSVDIWKKEGRTKIVTYWEDKYNAILAELDGKDSSEALRPSDRRELNIINEFRQNVGEILATIAGVNQPRDFEGFLTYGFDAADRDD